MAQITLRCNENDWILSKNQDLLVESPPLINSKAIIYNGGHISGMLHISNDFGINKIADFLKEINVHCKQIGLTSFKIAMKTINADYESDKYLVEISKKLGIPIEKIHSYIIPMDSKKIVTMKINKKGEIIELF